MQIGLGHLKVSVGWRTFCKLAYSRGQKLVLLYLDLSIGLLSCPYRSVQVRNSHAACDIASKSTYH
jgi:hypothetical protein